MSKLFKTYEPNNVDASTSRKGGLRMYFPLDIGGHKTRLTTFK